MSGETMRDRIAMAALPAVIKRCNGDTRYAGETLEELFARKAYAVADAFLAARGGDAPQPQPAKDDAVKQQMLAALQGCFALLISQKFEQDAGKPPIIKDGVWDKIVNGARAAIAAAEKEQSA